MFAAALASLLAAAAVQPSLQPRSRPYDATRYKLELKLGEDGAFTNRVTISLKPKGALKEVELDVEGLDVTGATLADGTKVPFEVKDKYLLLRPQKPLAAGAEAQLVVTVTGKATEDQNGFFVTWNPDDPQKTPYYFTHFETASARKFFPCNDQPFDKAATEVLAVVPGELTVLSNGVKLTDEAFSEGGRNLRRIHWLQEKPHATYLVAVAIGKFEGLDSGSDVPSTLWVLPGTADRAFVATDATMRALSSAASITGVKYPWEKYDQVVVPRFFWSGMENTGLTTLRENAVILPNRNYLGGRASTVGLIAHEVAHQWFGDLVTLKWWDDVWLNEGFATWLGAEATDRYFDNDLVDVDRAADTFVSYFREEDGPRSHPLKGKDLHPAQLFDNTSYVKGAHVLRMLEHWVGKEQFKAGLKAYLDQYAYSNATSDDFFAAVGRSTKKDKEVRAFKDGWLLQRGYPILTPTWEYADGTLTVTVKQRPNHADVKKPFVFKLPVVFHRTNEPTYATEAELVIDRPVVTAKFQLPATPQWVNWNKGGTALAKIDPVSVSEEQWTLATRNSEDPVWRLLAQLSLMSNFFAEDLTELNKPSDTALGALLDGLSSDPSPYVREAMLQRLGQSSWPRLPAELGPAVLALAKRPEKLPEDPLGNVRVRAAALALLGKIDFAEGRKYALSQLQKGAQLDVNYVRAAAVSVGRIGDSVALAELTAAVRQQKARGSFFWVAAAAGLGEFPGPEVVPHLRDLLSQAKGNNEVGRVVPQALSDNRQLLRSPEAAALVREVVLGADWGESFKGRMLRLLDEVKTAEAKAALEAIAQGAASPQLKSQAERVLAANFPPPPPAKAPGKGKKK